MSEFKVQPRPDRDPKQSGQKISRHRAEPAKPISAWAQLKASIPSFGRRTALVATACAVVIGVGAAGQAAEQAAPEAASATSEAAPTLNFDKSLVSALPAPTASAVAPQSVAKPAEKPAAKPAAAAKAAPKATAAKAPVKAAAPAAKVAPAKAAAPAPKPAAAVAVNDPAGAQAYAARKLSSYGWAGQMQCLKKLWTKESEWRTTATNPSSGAYGIVQSLPAEKMATAGADYRTNYRTQINWGLDYIKERYGSPCQALNFHYANNWY
jgi:colicin import membrane protein